MAEKNKEEKKSFADTFSAVVTKYRVLLLGIIVGLIVIAIAAGISVSVTQSFHKKALTEVDAIVYKLTQASADSGDSVRADSLAALQSLAEKNKRNVAGVRAYMVIAELYYNDSEWEAASEAWLAAARAGEKSYTAPLAYYNAAVCEEELGNLSDAVSYYEKALTGNDFYFTTHTLFSIGRIKESLNDFAGAAVQYEKLHDTYPSDLWTSLAESRLIELRAEGKI